MLGCQTNTANLAGLRGQTLELGMVKEKFLVLSNLDERNVGTT